MPTTMERLQVEVTADTSRAVADLHRFEAEVRRTSAIVNGLGGRPTGIDTSALLADLRRLEAEARRTAGIIGGVGSQGAGSFGRTGSAASRAASNVGNLGNQTNRASDSMARLAKYAAGAVAGAGLGRMFVGGIKKAMDFDTTMRMVAVQTGQTGKAMTSLSDTALKMGADTIYSASESGQAMLELAKGGLTAAQIKSGALQQALTLAAAGGLELADSASAVVNGMGAFGLKASEAGRITTALAGAANASSADVSDLTLSLQAGAAAAAGAGFSIEETAAAFAIFANNGVKGSDAGTSFKTMVASLTPVTDKAKNTMKKYGLEFTTADGKFKSLRDVAATLRKGLGGLSQVQRAVALETIFGSDASRAAKFIMDAGRKGVDKYTKATSNQKSAQDLANVAMSGASGAWQNFTGSVETATITLGQKMLPTITKVLTAGTDLVADAQGWGDDFRTYFGWMGESATGFYNTVKPLGSMLAGTARFIDGLPGPVKEVGVQAAIAALILPRFSGAVASATGAIGFQIARLQQWRAAMTYSATSAQATAAMMTRLAGAAKMAAGIGGMVLLTQAMQQTTEASAGMMGALGGAALGFSVAGPWGAAIGGISGALVGMNSVQQTTLDLTKGLGKATQHYTDTLDDNTGAVTRATRVKAYDLLMSDKATASAIKTANAYGISSTDIISSTLGNRGAQERLSDALAKLDARYNKLQQSGKAIPDSLMKTRQALMDVTQASGEQRATLGRDLLAARDKARAVKTWGEALKGIPANVRSELKADGYKESRRQVDELVTKYGLIPEQKRTLYTAFGFDKVKGDLASMTAAWAQVPASIKDLGIGDAAAGVAVSTAEIGANLATLKQKFTNTQLNVFIKATGSDTTVAEVRRSTEAFRTLPESVSTSIYALGGNATRGDIRRVAQEAKITDGRTIKLMFAAVGVRPTKADIAAIRGELETTGKVPANLKPWAGGVTSGTVTGKRTAKKGASDVTAALSSAGKGAKPNLSAFQGAITAGIVQGRGTASTGSAGIGYDLKAGFSVGFAGAGGMWSTSVRGAVAAAISAGRAEADAHSPSRKTARLGRDMGDGLTKGMKERAKAVREAAMSLVGQSVQAFKTGEYAAATYLKSVARWAQKSLSAHTKASVVGLVARDNKRLGALYDKRATLTSRLTKAEADLESRRAVKSSFIDATYTGMYQQANVLNAGDNAGTIASSLQGQVGKVKEFASLIKRLKKMGYRSDIIAQISQAGVEQGITAARALASASSVEQKSINSSYASISSTAKSASQELGTSLYNSGIRAADGLVVGLKKRRKAVEDALIDMAVAMQRAIKRALGIHSPSKVMAALGGHAGQGLVDGVLGKEKAAAVAGQRLARSIVVTPPRLAVADTTGVRGPRHGPMAVAGQVGGGVVFQFTTHNPIAEPQSRTTNKALEKAANLGLA
jgi:TP901 family phage tail tape measure protein